jgi:hypothetical protein
MAIMAEKPVELESAILESKLGSVQAPDPMVLDASVNGYVVAMAR